MTTFKLKYGDVVWYKRNNGKFVAKEYIFQRYSRKNNPLTIDYCNIHDDLYDDRIVLIKNLITKNDNL